MADECLFVCFFVCLFELQSTVVDDDAIGRVTITCRVLEPGAAGYAPCRSFGSGLVRPRAASDCRLRLVTAPGGKHPALPCVLLRRIWGAVCTSSLRTMVRTKHTNIPLRAAGDLCRFAFSRFG